MILLAIELGGVISLVLCMTTDKTETGRLTCCSDILLPHHLPPLHLPLPHMPHHILPADLLVVS